MTTWRASVGGVFLCLLGAGRAFSEAAADRPTLEPARTATPPVLDGVLDDSAWSGPPFELGEWLTYNPLNGARIAQRTEVRAVYDDRALYLAFHCVDPEPDKVRSTLSRRDRLWNDDWVGFSLDSVGTGQSSYDMFVNPRGVQGDILTTSSAGENTAPDWVWESAGRATEQGYDVEVRLPFKSLRFKSGRDVRMGILFWRRVSRLGTSASWPEVPAGRSFLERHATLLLHDLKAPLTLELIPSATYSWNQVRATPSAFSPADTEPDAGLSVKYGLTSSTALEGTVNPDFSQVESDAFQVEVNQRFPLFFDEKRPFFMEGMGTFELAGTGGDAQMRTAVHTRRIVDPAWGGKLTGTVGRLTFATLSASDEAAGRSEAGAGAAALGHRQAFHIARGVYSLGRDSYVGGLLTDSELASGYNRVAGGDVSLRRGKHKWSTTLLGSTSRSPEGGESRDGLGGQAFYSFESRRVVLVNQIEHYDRAFQMDTAFLNRTGVTTDWTYGAVSFYPDPKKHAWIKRVVPFVFTRLSRDRIQGGDERLVVPGIRMNFTRQGFFRLDASWGREPFAGRSFATRNIHARAEAQIKPWLYVFARTDLGRAVYYDVEAPFLGRSRSHQVELTLQPSARFNQFVSWNRVEFDRLSGERVFDVDVVNLRTTYQFDAHFFVRGIVQYDSSRRQVLTDALASFELLPGTVAYAGYGSLIERREWDGSAWRQGPGEYRTTRRGFFFKASYIHRF
jgi:hypothetical protein